MPKTRSKRNKKRKVENIAEENQDVPDAEYDEENEFDFTDDFIVCDSIYSQQKKAKYHDAVIEGTDIDKKQWAFVKKELDDRDIDIVGIINSDMAPEDKADIYELYEVMTRCREPEMELKYKQMINSRIKTSFTQKETQLKKELMELQRINKTIENRILQSNHPKNIKAIIYKKFKDVESNGHGSDEYIKMMQWVTTALQIPTSADMIDIKQDNTPAQFLTNIHTGITNQIYGQANVKERVLEIATAMWSNPNTSRKCIVLVGPPGTGKTSFAHCLAASMNLPFYKISFGGARDVSFLKGHGMTYIGSKHGVILDALITMKCLNGVVYLGELDKIPDTPEGASISAALLHIMDFGENDKFIDEYIPEIPVDLSKLMFVVSVNSVDNIDPVLLNRFTTIQMEPYSDDDKVEIGLNYSVPKILKNINMNPANIKIDKAMMKYILQKSEQESGMRELERNIEKIYQKLATLHLSQNTGISLSYSNIKVKFPLKLTKEWIDILLKN